MLNDRQHPPVKWPPIGDGYPDMNATRQHFAGSTGTDAHAARIDPWPDSVDTTTPAQAAGPQATDLKGVVKPGGGQFSAACGP